VIVVVADFDDGKVIAVVVEGAVVVVVFAVVVFTISDVGRNDLHSLHLRGPIRFQKTHAHETRKKIKGNKEKN